MIGIDDEDDSTFTITVDQKTFHFQGETSLFSFPLYCVAFTGALPLYVLSFTSIPAVHLLFLTLFLSLTLSLPAF